MDTLLAQARVKGGRVTEITDSQITFTCDNNHTSTYTKATIEKRVRLNRWIKCRRTHCIPEVTARLRKEEQAIRHARGENERRFAGILKELLPHIPFKKVRPFWLKNPETGRNLEIDLYSEEYKLGFEYQEDHHCQPNDFADYTVVRARDDLKVRRCKLLGIKLYQIPDCDDLKILRDAIFQALDHKVPEKRGVTRNFRRGTV